MAVINKPPRAAENIKKQLCAKFKEFGLKITATANLKIIDFLECFRSREGSPWRVPEEDG